MTEINHQDPSSPNYSVARTFDDMMQQCQWISHADMKRLQDASLKIILAHAWGTVPYYRDTLGPLFQNGEEANLSRWTEVPFLTRRDIQDNFDALKSSKCPPEHGKIQEAKSSGSTAEPVTVLTTGFASVASAVASARGMDWAGVQYRINQAQIIPMGDGSAPYPGIQIDAPPSPFWREPTTCGNWHQLDYTTSHGKQLSWLAERGRCYLNTMPTNLRELVRRIDADPSLAVDVAGVFTLGEIVTDDLRERVRKTLGCEIHDSYSTEEHGCLAFQCPDSTNLHVADELYLVEVIDEATGFACKPGETGSVVITSFYNQAMPLIRYRLGDLATVGEPCNCGRGLSAITKIVGRRRQIFRFPGGETIMSGLSPSIFSDFLKARKWQVAQVGDETIEVRFVSDTRENEQDRKAFVADANRRFQRKLNYVFKQVGEIPHQPSGKFFEFVCELPDKYS